MNVMLDIETLGTTPGCAILSIGAVMFDSRGVGPGFYCGVSARSCVDLGLTIEPETVAWWMLQSDKARAEAFSSEALLLSTALTDFSAWFSEKGGEKLWCHGATFDEPIIQAAFRTCHMRAPWHFADVRDTRTLYDLADVTVDRSGGTHHNALDDATAQAHAAVRALRRLEAV